MAFTWTKEQKQVIELRDRDILVSAAAGSGKTAVLVERIIAKISDKTHPVDIDRLLIVTFTNAAAGEMRERIAQAIQRKVEEEPDNTHLQRQMTLVHTAQITTIHSFCLYVIRNHFHRINLDPSFRIGDEGELKLMQEDVLDSMMEEYYETADPEFLRFVDMYATGRDDGGIRDMILKCYDFSRSYPWPDVWLSNCVKSYDIQNVEDLEKEAWMKYFLEQLSMQLWEYVRIYDRILAICAQEDGPSPYLEKFSLEQERLKASCQFETYQEAGERLKAIVFETKPRRKKTDTYSQDLADQVSSMRDRVKAGLKKITAGYFFKSPKQTVDDIKRAKEAVEQMVKLTKDFSIRFTEKKREKNLVDFGDLEHLALSILMVEKDGKMVPSEVADQMAQWYEEIMIDEYQDSNYVQEVLLNSVSSKRFGRPDIFMVGDVKQSIYKFRLAKPELFMEKYESYTEEESLHQKIELHQNFRSRASVLFGVNYFFYQIMKKELGDITYTRETALNPGLEYADTDLPVGNNTEMLFLDLTDNDSEEDSGTEEENRTEEALLTEREWEARMVAARIRKLVDATSGQYVWDKNEERYRKASYRDIVILLRTVSGWAECFTEVLMSEGIPAYAESQSGYFTALEVQVVLNLLRLIDNPIQDVPLASVLHSHIGGLTSEELARIRMGYPVKEMGNGLFGALSFYLEHHSGDGEELTDKIETFVERLNHYRRAASYMPIHELIVYVLGDSGYYDYISAMPAGERRKANLDMLVERAVAYEKTSYRGVFQFVRYIEKLQKYSVDYGEASIIGENEDTVRIMSIHKSKGLEFPIVFLSGTAKPFNKQDTRNRVIFHPDFGIGMDVVNPVLRVRTATLMKKVFQNKLLLENLGEELRVLYVAMTRAREKLIVTGAKKKFSEYVEHCVDSMDPGETVLSYDTLTAAGSYLDWIIPALLKHRAAGLLYEYAKRPMPLFSALYHDEAEFCVNVWEKEQVMMETVSREAKKIADKRFLAEIDMNQVECEKEAEWIETCFTYPYHYNDMDKMYATVSVSDLKRQHLSEEDVGSYGIEENVEKKNHLEDGEQTIPRFLMEEETVSGARRGTVYHRIMEWLDLEALYACGCMDRGLDEKTSKKILEKWLYVQLNQMEQEGRLSDQEKNAVWMDDLSSFYLSDLGRRMVNAYRRGELKREQQFLLGVAPEKLYPEIKAPKGEILMIQGVIDAWFYEEDNLILVDYKTDRVKQGEENLLEKRYGEQLFQYARALFMITGKEVKEAWIYSFSLKQPLRIIWDRTKD